VKLFAQAMELEKPFRVLICRDWYRDSKNSIGESILIVDLARRDIFLLARVGGLIISLSWAHLLSLLCVALRLNPSLYKAWLPCWSKSSAYDPC
jgi:hypothetical protein